LRSYCNVSFVVIYCHLYIYFAFAIVMDHEQRRTVGMAMMQSIVSTVAADDNDLQTVVDVAVRLCDAPMLPLVLRVLDDERKQGDRVTIENFVENTVSKYSLFEFRNHFRMTRSCFQASVNYALDVTRWYQTMHNSLYNLSACTLIS